MVLFLPPPINCPITTWIIRQHLLVCLPSCQVLLGPSSHRANSPAPRILNIRSWCPKAAPKSPEIGVCPTEAVLLQDNERDLLGGLLHTVGGGAGPDRLPVAGVHCAQIGGLRKGEYGEEDSQAKEKLYGIGQQGWGCRPQCSPYLGKSLAGWSPGSSPPHS